LKEVEPGYFELYRDVMIEENGVAEKYGKPIHISFLREATKDEEADLTTSRPDGTVLLLRKLPRGDEIEQ
jgi:predicted RNA-binding protein with PUA domain